ncbi:MAG TPA: hypothetical protein DCX49_08200, partial [Flavobacteriales bacterium]|nr:hypothetical protein [Flavobacteriales bacterium]
MSWQASAQMLGVSVEVDTVFGGPSPDFDPNGELEGYTSYLVYANFTNPTDVLSAVFADTEAFEGTAVLGIDAPCGCFNPDEGSMVIGSFVNSNFSNIPQFALYQYDTFWTIGQEFSDDAGTTPDWVSFPPIDGSNICEEEVNDGTMFITGSTGSWPVNAVAGNDLKILLARVTTCGEFTFTMNAQVFVEGLQSNPELFTMCEFADFDLDGICDDVDDCVGLYDACGVCNGPGPIEDCGCDDIPAGFCDCDGNQIDAIGICGGTCPADADNDGICDDVDPCIGSFDAIGVCGGDCLADDNNNGICDDDEVLGCTDEFACNFDPDATVDDASCIHCDCVQTGDYTLSVEASPALTLPGHTRYRIYLNTPNLNDRLKEVVGSGDSPMTLNVPGGIYNSSLNPLFFPGFAPTTYCPFPELTDDSYLTIGLTTSQAYLPGAQTPALYGGALNNPLVDFFTVDGGTSLTIDDGGGVYVANNTATNIYPDANGRIIVMQVTTDGPISGTLNFGVWPMGGDASTQIDLTISFDGVGEFSDGSGDTSLCGCTDPSAFNYDSSAEHDNDSCLPLVPGCNDPSACTFSYDANVNDGSCADCDFCGVCAGDGLSCSSCTDAAACNYDPDATADDGSCEYESCAGCLDTNACNYAPDATIEDGSCEYVTCAGCLDSLACNYDPDATLDDGNCDFSCYGCTIDFACNYDANATVDDDSCEFESCAGCLVDIACNYDATATIDDGSCDYESCAGCLDFSACNYDPSATIEDGSCDFTCYGC